jgi:hypothetical protein
MTRGRPKLFLARGMVCRRLVTPQGVARYVARQASQSRHPRAGSGGLQVTTVDRPSGAADQLDRTTRAASSRPRPNGTRRLTLEHDRVGAGSMADLGYVPEQTLCEKINEENLPVLQVYLVILDVLAMFLCHDVRSLQRSLQNLVGKL